MHEERIINEFKRFWLEGVVIKEMDYPIFFAVNKRPVKDNGGDYRYIKLASGDFKQDEYGHPFIDHDLDEIAELFIKFAKEKDLNFWKA